MNNKKQTYELYNRQSDAIASMTERDLNDYYQVGLQLLDYFNIKHSKRMVIADDIMTEIERLFHCDLSRLSTALSRYTHFKDGSLAHEYGSSENSFDVSLNSKVRVKGFLSKGQPFLYFFRDSDDKPTLKIKYLSKEKKPRVLIESATNPDMLCEYKNGTFDESISGVVLDSREYILSNDALNISDFMYTQTTPVIDDNKRVMCDISKLSDEYLAFYIFLLKQQNHKNNTGASDIFYLPITEENAEVLFDSYYNTVKSVVEPSVGLSLSDLLMIMSSIKDDPGMQITDYMPIDKTSELVRSICSLEVQNDTAQFGKQVTFVNTDKSGKNTFYNVSKRKGDMSIDILDETQKVVCKYLFIPTKDGFSIIRNIPNSIRTLNPDEIVSASITLSDDDLKFVAYSGKKASSISSHEDRAVDINLHLGDAGKFTLKKFLNYTIDSGAAKQAEVESVKAI